jgi:prolipoprotein diacylglyceryltransferase
VVEFFRAKDDRFFGALTVAQVIALLFIASGLAIMAARRRVTAEAQGIYATA